MRITLIFILCLYIMPEMLCAQTDTIIVDSATQEKQPGVLKIMFQGKPGKALTYSLLLPGMGQVYNKKYWKIPIVYAGLGVAGYFVYFNNKEYKRYKNAYILRIDLGENSTDEFQGILSAEGIKSLRNYHDKYLQMSYIAGSLVYLLNGIEAFVDRHLMEFDVSDNLSLQIRPSQHSLGLGLCFALK